MRNPKLNKLFVDELKGMYSSESQTLKALPKLIKLASLPELKETLSHHLAETEDQLIRIERIFSLLAIDSSKVLCRGMEGILMEVEEIIANKPKSTFLDAAIISAVQKIEHYEIASYRTLISFAHHLELTSEIVDLLHKNLDEENAADKKLTKIAEGSFFSSGVNEEAAVVAEVF